MTQNQLMFWQNVETARANRAREAQQMFQTAENARHNLASEEIDASKAQSQAEQAKASWQNAVTNAYNAEINKQNADTNRLNWEVNAKNALTNARNAAVNARNAAVNEYNADTNRMNYGVNWQNAMTREWEARIAERNTDINERNAITRENEYLTRMAVSKSQIALNKQKVQESMATQNLRQAETQDTYAQRDLKMAQREVQEKEAEWYNSKATADIWNKSVDTIHKGVSLVTDVTRGVSGIKNLISLLTGGN